MKNYIDGFVLPIPRAQLNEYKLVAASVAEIWKEHGAIAYFEYVDDGIKLEGTRSFPDFAGTKENEATIFGWVVFESRQDRDLVNERVAKDPRMGELIAPLLDPSSLIFDAERMIFGGFKSLV